MNNHRSKIKKHLKNNKLKKQIYHKIIIPNYMIDRSLQVEFEIVLNSPHLNSKLTVISDLELGIEVSDVNQIVKRLSNIYARLINQYKFSCKVVFPDRFDIDQQELFITSQTDINKIDVVSHIQRRDSCWRFNIVDSMEVYF